MSFTPDLVTAFEDFILAILSGVNTCLPGRVIKYDKDTQQVEVLPLIKAQEETQTGAQVVSRPVVPGVPVVFPGAGAYKITFPIKPGDTVLLVVSQQSLDRWLQLGGEVDPQDPRRFDLSDAVVVPGLLPFNRPSDQVKDDALVLAAPDGAEVLLGSKDADDPVVRKSDLDSVIDALNAHVHTGVTTGGGSSATPLDTFSKPSGSDKVKVD